MPSLGGHGSDQAVYAGIVVFLTALWWACAVGVTVVLKVALGSDSGPVPGVWSFPFPLTLTLLANVGTAVCCGLLASIASRNGLDGGGTCEAPAGSSGHPRQPVEQPPQSDVFPPTPRTMMRASSREALLQTNTTSPDPTAVAAALARGDFAGCPGGGALASCGCWSRRRKRGALAQAPLELEMFAEPEVVLGPPPEEGLTASGPALGTSPPPPWSADHLGFKGRGTVVCDPGGPMAPAACNAPGGPGRCGAAAPPAGGALSEQNVALVTMGLIQGLALGAKNEALLLLSVSTRTMIFATNVLVVMLVARLFGLEKLKKTKLVSAFFLASGGMLQGVSSWLRMRREGSGGRADEPLGYALAILALVLDAMRWVLLQAVFAQEPPPSTGPPTSAGACQGEHREPARDRGGSEGGTTERALLRAVPLSKLRMVSWVMWTTTPVCLGLSIFFEPSGLLHASRHPVAVLGLVALLTVGVMGINVAEFGIVQWTSAVTFNVLSQLHSIPLVLAGVTCFGERIAPIQVLGFGICLVGALMYSVVRNQEKRMMQGASDGLEQVGSAIEVPLAPAHQAGDVPRRQGFA